jgi:phosphate/sulfate permease
VTIQIFTSWLLTVPVTVTLGALYVLLLQALVPA